VTTAIPTRYGGTQFRSRLEARWAAFFDLLGWSWEYEPIDLEGYIPDFVLCEHVLAEVKPFMWRRGGTMAAAEHVLQRAVNAASDAWDWVAVLGACLIDHEQERENIRQGIALGIVSERRLFCPGQRVITTLDATWWSDTMRVDLLAQPMLGGRVFDAPPDLVALWREAGNRVQWRTRGVP